MSMTKAQLEKLLEAEGAIIDDPDASVESKREASARIAPLIFAYAALISDGSPDLASVAEQIGHLSHSIGTLAPIDQEAIQRLARDARSAGAEIGSDILADAGESLIS